MSFFCKNGVAQGLHESFPSSINHHNFISYGRNTPYLHKLRDWFRDNKLSVNLFAEIDDSALLKVLGEAGMGIFSAPTYIEEEVSRQYGVDVIGRADSINESLYAIYRYSGVTNPIVDEILRVNIDPSRVQP